MTLSREQSAIEAVRNDFIHRGYDVFLEPDANSLLPAELQVGRFRPDLIAKGNGETIVVEIKLAGKHIDPAIQQESARWARIIKDLPGWHYHVVWYEPDEISDTDVPERDNIYRNLQRSKSLFASGDTLAATLLLWATFEAAAMYALRKEGIALKKSILGPAIISTLIYHGVLDDEDVDSLRRFVTGRNAIAHGNLTASVDYSDFELTASITQRLLAIEELV